MKILHVAETIKGGIATALSEIIPAQTRTFGRENVLALVPSDQVIELPELHRLQYRVFPRRKRGIQALLALAWATYVALIKERPDVLHLHSSFAGFVGRIVTFFVKKKPSVVYCAHGWAFTMDVSKTKKFIYAFIEKWLANYTDGIVNISHFEADAAIAQGLPQEKMVTIHNGITPLMMTAPAKVFDLTHQKTFLFVGRFDKQKGIDLLVNALRLIDHPDFIIYVVGQPVLDNNPVPFPTCVKELGWCKRSEMAEMYCKADALIVPSRWEGFGLVAIEAMSCGTPVLASIYGALSEIVTHGHTGLLFDPYDANTFSQLLVDTRVDKLAIMGQAAAIDMRNRFAATTMTEALQAYIEILLKKNE